MSLKCQQLYLEEIFRGKDTGKRNYMAVQWLGLHAFTAVGPGSILGGKTKIPQGLQHRPLCWGQGWERGASQRVFQGTLGSPSLSWMSVKTLPGQLHVCSSLRETRPHGQAWCPGQDGSVPEGWPAVLFVSWREFPETLFPFLLE